MGARLLVLLIAGSGALFSRASRAEPVKPVLHGAAFLWEPYEFYGMQHGSRVLTGFHVELIRDVLGLAGYSAEFREIRTRQEHVLAVESGDADFTTSPRIPERERFAFFSDPIRHETNMLFVRPAEARDFQFHDVAGMIDVLRRRGVRLGLMRGFVYGPDAFSKLIGEGKASGAVTELDTPADLMDALTESKKIDAFLIDRLAGETVAFQTGRQALMRSVMLPRECNVDICLMFSRKTVARPVVARVNDALARMRRTSHYGELVRLYSLPVLLSMTIYTPWFLALDLLGTLAFAISGVIVARRERFSLFGAFVMAALPTIGGGVVRDLIVGRRPVTILRSPLYLLTILGVVLIGFAVSKLYDALKPEGDAVASMDLLLHTRAGYALELFDAIGLAAFLVAGVFVAVENRASPLVLWGPALATLSACGGGILRDV
ncbi:MAG TPA: TRIC cation channel family protein, partial [Thermoanaerobaculia bacterium]|nr:TRIC cation channel family protein [Thermoanaerobaculia bacterium]